MRAGDQNYSRAGQFKCLSDPTVPLSVWIVPNDRLSNLRIAAGWLCSQGCSTVAGVGSHL
jgi:hypothetical protein